MPSQMNDSLSLQDAWNSGYLAAQSEKFDNSLEPINGVGENNSTSPISSIESYFVANQIDYEKNISLKLVTKRNNEGLCSYFCKPNNLDTLKRMVIFFNNEKLNFEVIGDSSNVYFLECEKHNIIISTTKLNNFIRL